MVAVMMGFSSCAMNQVESVKAEPDFVPTKVVASEYMSAEVIKAKFQEFKEGERQEKQMSSPEYLERLKSLAPDNLFVTNKHIDELHAQISERSRENVKSQKSQMGSSDRRDCAPKVVNQCGGTCTSHGLTNAMDNLVCNPK